MVPRLYDLPPGDWPLLRPELTRGVAAWPLLPPAWQAEKIAITRVAPGGEFPPHHDDYHHVFWFLTGEGEGSLAEEIYPIFPGRVVEVPAGTAHGYRNTGKEDLLLLTINAREEMAEKPVCRSQ